MLNTKNNKTFLLGFQEPASQGMVSSLVEIGTKTCTKVAREEDDQDASSLSMGTLTKTGGGNPEEDDEDIGNYSCSVIPITKHISKRS